MYNFSWKEDNQELEKKTAAKEVEQFFAKIKKTKNTKNGNN